MAATATWRSAPASGDAVHGSATRSSAVGAGIWRRRAGPVEPAGGRYCWAAHRCGCRCWSAPLNWWRSGGRTPHRQDGWTGEKLPCSAALMMDEESGVRPLEERRRRRRYAASAVARLSPAARVVGFSLPRSVVALGNLAAEHVVIAVEVLAATGSAAATIATTPRIGDQVASGGQGELVEPRFIVVLCSGSDRSTVPPRLPWCGENRRSPGTAYHLTAIRIIRSANRHRPSRLDRGQITAVISAAFSPGGSFSRTARAIARSAATRAGSMSRSNPKSRKPTLPSGRNR